VSQTTKQLFARECFNSNNIRYRLTTILMRVLGILTREEAASLMKKIHALKSDQKILDELTALFPEKRIADQGKFHQIPSSLV
jgi:hypothetical protein